MRLSNLLNAPDGPIVRVKPDLAYFQDRSGLLLASSLSKQIDKSVFPADRVWVFTDHNIATSEISIANLIKSLEIYSKKLGLNNVPAGSGVSHAWLEKHLQNEVPQELPRVIVSTDSHVTQLGVLKNTLGLHISLRDIEILFENGEVLVKNFEIIKIGISGSLPKEVNIWDAIAPWIEEKKLKDKIICFSLLNTSLSQSKLSTLCNLAADAGAIGVFFDSSNNHIDFELNLNQTKRHVFFQGELVTAEDLQIRVNSIHLGSCSQGRYEDISEFIKEVKLLGIQREFPLTLYVVPSSIQDYKTLTRTGELETLIDMGAVILPPGCGPCMNIHQGVTALGEIRFSTRGKPLKDFSNIIIGSITTAAKTFSTGIVC